MSTTTVGGRVGDPKDKKPSIAGPRAGSTIDCNSLAVDFTAYADGNYFIQVLDENGTVVAQTGPFGMNNGSTATERLEGMNLSAATRYTVRVYMEVDGRNDPTTSVPVITGNCG